MEQKQANSLEAEIDEIKKLLADVASNQISNFLGEADTAEMAAKLTYLIAIIEDKLTRLAKTYPLYQGNKLAILPALLHKNAAELKESWERESITIEELGETIYDLLGLSTKHCIQFETVVAYQSINGHLIASAVTMEQWIAATNCIQSVIQRATDFVNAVNTSNKTYQSNVEAQQKTQEIFELSEKINKNLHQLTLYYQENVVSKKNAVAACVIKIAEIMQAHQEQIEMNFHYLIKIFETINNALLALAKRLTPKNLSTILHQLKEKFDMAQKHVASYISLLFSEIGFLTEEEISNVIDKNSYFLELREKTIAKLEKTIELAADYNHPIDKKITEDFEYFLRKLSKQSIKQIELGRINELIEAIFERLEQTEKWLTDQTTRQTNTLKLKESIENKDSFVKLAEKRSYCFKFFHSPTNAQPEGFHILCENQVGYHHLAHFYLICKDWPVPSKSTNFPGNAINLIFWWVLKLSTDEEKNQLYMGRSGGLKVKAEPIKYPLTLVDEETFLFSVSKFFTLVQPIREAKTENDQPKLVR